MDIEKTAIAGTLESSDAMVTVEPGQNGIELTVSSPVLHQFGRAIKRTVLDTAGALGVENARITVNDKGALECTLRARLESAIYRSAGQTENIPWGKKA
ncbi:MAG TPA: citrate lyase acyl carrier protein [Candidatus Limnocylindria bacterium]|nr:citrate lyase acyl carrier protein [Candidatus Limnocylindria bacterium]